MSHHGFQDTMDGGVPDVSKALMIAMLGFHQQQAESHMEQMAMIQLQLARLRRSASRQQVPATAAATARTPAAIRTIRTTSFKPVPPSTVLTGANRVPLLCDHCHKPGHTRQVCRRLRGLCLRCDQAGHMARACPSPDSRGPRAGASQAQWDQIFASIPEETEASAPVIPGTSGYYINILMHATCYISSCLTHISFLACT